MHWHTPVEVILWFAAVAATARLAWAPWRAGRRQPSVLVEDGAGGFKVVSPLVVFAIPALLAAFGGVLFVVLLLNRKDDPSSPFPLGVFAGWLVFAVLGQLALRRAIFAYLRRRREAREKGWLTPDTIDYG